jgi:hypothetical protein
MAQSKSNERGLAVANVFRPMAWLRAADASRLLPLAADNESDETCEGPLLDPPTEAPPSGVAPVPSVVERVYLKAYRHWCRAGCPSSSLAHFWAVAEREFLDGTQ